VLHQHGGDEIRVSQRDGEIDSRVNPWRHPAVELRYGEIDELLWYSMTNSISRALQKPQLSISYLIVFSVFIISSAR